MIELNIAKNNNGTSKTFGKYYARVEYKKTMSIHDMAVHMAEHNTPFSVGTIEGILRDFVACTREQFLQGNTVKVDDLAVFKCSVAGNPLTMNQKDNKVIAGLGAVPTAEELSQNPQLSQCAVKSAKLLAQATGEFTKKELNTDVEFRWTSKAQEEVSRLCKEPKTGEGD